MPICVKVVLVVWFKIYFFLEMACVGLTIKTYKMKNMTIKELLILFQEWQLETKAPNYNFAHNGVANNFLEHHKIKHDLICCPHEKFSQNICEGCGLTSIQIKEGFTNWLNKAIK